MKDLIALLQSKINRNGELHLQKSHADLLIKWLKSVQETLEEQEALVSDLQKFFSIEKRRFSENEGDL